jgi:hypothetical protein
MTKGRGESGKPRRNPLLGAAVLKALLRRGDDDAKKTQGLYEGILRDLDLTDEQVEQYLADHAEEVEAAIRGHGRRGS